MSNDVVIRVEKLSKRYRLGLIGGKTLQEDVQRWWAKLRGKPDPLLTVDQLEKLQAQNSMPPAPRSMLPSPDGHIWALRDINFEVKQGEILGIIGANGAGKSTLLKILTRITAPTKGRALMEGRVGALLEVGTGFHGELTGRENIFLSGAILGMTKAEVQSKLDEIIDFSGCEQYIDTPIKRYSSGMNVRLGFAVAAHLEPEILLIDEVLAVGDAQFQKKCLGKMEDVAKEGRTILFVSHNMPMITSLCPRCLLLESGKIAVDGRTSDVVMSYYTSDVSSPSYFEYSDSEKKPGDEFVQLLSGAVLDQQSNVATEFDLSESVKIKMRFKVIKKDTLKLVPNFHFHSGNGTYAFTSGLRDAEVLEVGEYTTECSVPGNLLNDDAYFVGLAITSLERGVKVHFYEQSVLSFVVKDDLEGRQGYSGRVPGVVRPVLEWKIERTS